MSSSESKSITSVSRKRSRSPSLESGSTKVSRQSTSPKPHHGQPASDVGVALPPPATTKSCLIYIVNKKIPSAQLAHLKGIAKKKDFHLSDALT